MGGEWILFVFAAALGVAVLATPAMRAVAARFGWVDRPSRRKGHQRPTPLLGGVAIYLAVIASLVALPGRYAVREASAILIGASLVSLAGLWDDGRGLGVAGKLAVQALAAALLIFGGVQVALPLPEGVNIALSALWIVGVTNTINLLDNVDGLAGGIASIAAFFFLWLALANGQVLVGALAAALLGACLGFLLYNFNPASIFMGDAGSLFLGFVLAAVGIKLRFPDNLATTTWMVPILILAVPLADTCFVVVTRAWRGLNPLATPGRDHLSHHLIARGRSDRQAVVILYGAGGVTGLAGVFVSSAEAAPAYSVLVATVGAMIVACWWLGRKGVAELGGED